MNEIDFNSISKEDFKAYEKVRASGETNMFMITMVCELSGLERETVKNIMRYYSELNKKYPDVRKN